MNIVQQVQAIARPLGSLINLVTFDVLDVENFRVDSGADPLMVTLEYPMFSQIDKKIHTYLRKAIKDYLKQRELYAGEIKLEGVLRIKIYAKRRIKPAWES
jgi:hypothetical protein